MPAKSDKSKLKADEVVVKGLGVSSGIIVGKPYVLHSSNLKVIEYRLEDDHAVEDEIERFHQALQITREQLYHVIQEAKAKYGKEYSTILESHFLILEDEEMIRGTLKMVKNNHVNAESALAAVMDKFRNNFLKSNNEYLRERATDIDDVKRRILANLLGQHKTFTVDEPSVIIADTIKPSDIAGIERSKILGFVCESGSTLSHFAIVARSLNIPAVVGIANFTGFVADHDTLLVDGHTGEVIINPAPGTIERYSKKTREIQRQAAELEPVAQLPCTTKDGREIQLSANVELAEEVANALKLGAKGIGLYRTEYMLFSERELPDEETQYQEYLKIARKISPHKLTMRTFDVGGDKIPLEILTTRGYVHEDNPMLGWRAIRIALECPEFFVPQIRAMLRLSAEFQVEIMIPMVISVSEVVQAKALIDKCKNELRKEKIPFNEKIKVGIMIETPGAALSADVLAEEVDFFSIGTNDLVQYTLAADRGNPKVAQLYNCFHPAVLQLIHKTISAAQKNHIHAAMCGEMAGNPYATIFLLGLGLNEFSVLPPVLPKIKKLIRETDIKEAEALAKRILNMTDIKEIEKLVTEVTKKKLAS
ncbi:phosphoenolpyruvate--protein phosphotransferase [bacterium]|nr:phosphoenolpyruvate--protein phosphotransferase [bacterium]